MNLSLIGILAFFFSLAAASLAVRLAVADLSSDGQTDASPSERLPERSV